jgi:hypothetical protein
MGWQWWASNAPGIHGRKGRDPKNMEVVKKKQTGSFYGESGAVHMRVEV